VGSDVMSCVEDWIPDVEGGLPVTGLPSVSLVAGAVAESGLGCGDVAPGFLSYRDAGSGLQIVVGEPVADLGRWGSYLYGAWQQYRRHGVESALDLDVIRDGRSTSLVFMALASDGEVVGGVRAQGPYVRAEQSHAVVEWAGVPAVRRVITMIEDRLPQGVVEGKTAWVADDVACRGSLVRCLSRAPVHAAALLGARFALGTSAEHTLGLWTATGAVVAEEVEPVAYPDDRYRTSLVWWDRCGPQTGVTEGERRALVSEYAQLTTSQRGAQPVVAPVLPGGRR
jgi:hypothetical protein